VIGGRWAGFAVLASGLALTTIGTVGTVAGGSSQPPAAAPQGPEPAEKQRAARTPKPRPVESETRLAEDPEEFYALFETAFRTNDAAFLFDRLHPTVLARYGEQQCRDYSASLSQPDIEVDVGAVTEVESFVYDTDGIKETVSDALRARVRLSSGGVSQTQRAHLVAIDEVLHWFTDCGDPE